MIRCLDYDEYSQIDNQYYESHDHELEYVHEDDLDKEELLRQLEIIRQCNAEHANNDVKAVVNVEAGKTTDHDWLNTEQKRKRELLAPRTSAGEKIEDMMQKLDGQNSGIEDGALTLTRERDLKRSKKELNSARSFTNDRSPGSRLEHHRKQ